MRYLSLNINDEQKKVYQHEVKQSNLKQAFDLIRNGVCTSRSELARVMRLSATAVSSLTDELIRHNLVIEAGLIHADTPGRRPMNIKINEKAKQIAVFSLSCEQGVFSLYDLSFNLIEEISFFYTDKVSRSESRGNEYAALFEDVLLNRSEKLERDKLLCVCISVPGVFLNNDHFYTAQSSLDAAVRPEIIDAFTRGIGAPVFIANHSMCMAYTEKKHMEECGEDADNLLFVNISDYVGSAVISNGSIFAGANDTAGDIGHLRAGSEGRPCACGGTDCLHHYLSLQALLEDVQAACSEEGLPCPASFDELAAQYGSNPAVDRVIASAAVRLADALAMLIYISSTDRIVVSGGISKLGDNFLSAVSERLSRLVYARRHSISYAATDDECGSRGIAQYLLDKTDEIIANHFRNKH